jgi:toxin ParE1/3/4
MVIQLSDLARQDLEDIRIYTVETWGREQWLIYYRQLVRAFERIADHPETGRDRSLFVPGMRSINCARHVVFYKCLEAANGEPVILRIIHQRRNMPGLLYYDDLNSV